MRDAYARVLGLRRLSGGGVGWRGQFDSDSGIRAALVLDYSGIAGGRFFANGDNNLSFGDLHTFTRASEATYRDNSGIIQIAANGVHRLDHDKDGNRIGLLVEEERTNKCLQSAALGTTWTIPGSNTALTSYATAGIFGTTTAEDVKHGDSAETIQQTITVTDNTVVTVSAFVHAGTTGAHDFVKLGWMVEAAGTNGFEAWFNISTGVVGTARATGTGSYTASSAAIENWGNGWYRIMATGQIVTGQTAGRFEIINTTADGVDTAEATNSVAWEAFQLEEGAFATSHIPTTTVAVTRARELCSVAVSAFGFSTTNGAWIAEGGGAGTGASTWPTIVGSNDTNVQFLRKNSTANDSVNTLVGTGATVSKTGSTGSWEVAVKTAMSYDASNETVTMNGDAVATASNATALGSVTAVSIGGGRPSGIEDFNGHVASAAYYAATLSDADLVAGTA